MPHDVQGDLPFTPLAQVLSVADLPTTPEVGLEALARHPSPDVRRAVARNPGTPEPVREQLSRDGDLLVRRAALGATTTASLLEADVATPIEHAVGVAANALTDPEVLTRLTRHPSPRVVRAAMVNASTPGRAVRRAAELWAVEDLFPTATSTHLAAPLGMVVNAHPGVAGVWLAKERALGFQTLVKHPKVPLRAVEGLVSRRGGAQWRSALALNPYVPDELAARTPATRRIRTELQQALQGRTAGRLWTLPVADQVAALQLGSHTLDHVLAEAPMLRPEAFEAVLRTGRSVQVQPDTLVRLVERTGPPGARLAHRHLGVTRLAATFPYSELLSRTTRGIHTDAHGLSDDGLSALVLAHLGTSPAAWENFSVLSLEWTGELGGLLETSSILRKR